MEKIFHKLMRVSLAASCTLSFVMPSMIRAQEVEANDEAARVAVYPNVQEITYLSDEGMKLEGVVNLVVHGDQSPATIQKIKALLDAENIQYTESSEVKSDQANILISSDKEHCEECGDDAGNINVLNEEQGYILNASNDVNTKGDVTIIGADKDGAYYGVMTLTQMMEQLTSDGRMAETVISDYPSVKLRGFVEGFYGYPWSFEDRLDLMSDSAKYKMNTYIYAPKDDPYHKDQWRTLYPADKAEELRQLAEEGKKDNMSFVWSVHPGTGFNYSNDNDYNALIAKFEQLYDLGVRQFGISYDDLSGSVNGSQHATLINKVNKNFVQAKGDVKPLIVVGTRYCNGWGPSMTSYFKPFMEILDKDVVVMWTGANTMSAITKAAYDWPKSQTGVDRDLAAWWNYPVNDYCDGNLMMSPLENLDNDVDNLTGFFLNPMSQAEASKVAIFSGADYSWNIPAFEKTSSWVRAIDELVPEASASFQRFADNISFIKDGFEFDESRYLVDDLAALNSALLTNTGIEAAAATLKADFETMKEDVANLRNIDNENLREEIKTHLDAYEVLADAGIDAMSAFAAAQKGDMTACLNLITSLKNNLAKVETFKIPSLEGNGTNQNVVKVGQKRIKPMLKDAVSQIQSLLMTEIQPEQKGNVSGTIKGLDSKSLDLEKGNYLVKDISGTLDADGNVVVKLPKAMRISNVTLSTSNAADLAVQYSLNGVEWKTVSAETNDEGFVAAIDASAAYIRVINATEAAVDVNISNVTIAPMYNVGKLTASTDLSTYQNNAISNIVDGKINTKFYSSAGASVGSFVRVDLGKAIPLFDVQAYYAVNPKGIQEGIDGFKATKLEISTDGVAWTQVGDIIKDSGYVEKTVDGQKLCAAEFNADGMMARYIRFVATESSDNWVQVYEVPYNKTVSNLGDDTVNLVDTNITSGNATSLYDRDLTTAFAPTSVNDGDTLDYAMTTTTNISTLTILQDAEAISEATVSVKDFEGNWKEVGTLSGEVNEFDINNNITNVKLTFHAGKPTPKIYEIIAKDNVKEDTAFTKTILKSVIDKTDTFMGTEKFAKLAPSVANMIRARFAEAKAVYANSNATNQEVLDAWLSLANALHYADFEADKTVLKTLIDRCDTLQSGDYSAGFEAMTEALNKAKEVYNDEGALQARIDGAYSALLNAYNALVVNENTGKETLTQLVEQFKNVDTTIYRDNDALKAFKKALVDAEALLVNEDATPTQIHEAILTLTNAYVDIRLIPDESLLQELKDFVAKIDALDVSAFSEDQVTRFMSARDLADRMVQDPNLFDEGILPEITDINAIIDGVHTPVDPEEPTTDVDRPTQTEDSTNPANPAQDVTPASPKADGTTKPGTTKTGDSTNLMGMAMMFIASAGAFVGLKKRKRNSK